MKTAKEYRLSGNLKREIQDNLDAKLDKLSKKKSPSEEHVCELAKTKKLLELTSGSIANPFINLISYSVPQNVEFLFSRHEIESGLLGRIIFMRGPSKRAPIRDHGFELKPSESIVCRLREIRNDRLPIYNDVATDVLKVVREYLEHDQNLNHPFVNLHPKLHHFAP